MRNRELSRQIQQLNTLIAKTTSASSGDMEIQAHWARYICVLSAGLMENALAELYTEYAKGAASDAVATHVRHNLSKIHNPKMQLFVQIASSFKKIWGEELSTYADQDGRKEALNAIMTNRHQIAHGGQSDISMARVKEYLQKSIELIEFVEEQCKK